MCIVQLIISHERLELGLPFCKSREKGDTPPSTAPTRRSRDAAENFARPRRPARAPRSPHGAMLPPWRRSWLLPSLLLVAVSSAAAEDLLDLLWPSPLLKIHDPLAQQQNAALKKLIMGVARNSPGVSKTNIGGWQSDVHFFERTEVPVTILRARAYHAVFRYLQVHLFQPPQITFCGP